MFNCFGWKGTLDLPGLTQVIRAFQDQTHMATLVGDDDNRVLGLSETNRRREKTAAWSIWSWRAVKVHLINTAAPLWFYCDRDTLWGGEEEPLLTQKPVTRSRTSGSLPLLGEQRGRCTSTHLRLWPMESIILSKQKMEISWLLTTQLWVAGSYISHNAPPQHRSS